MAMKTNKSSEETVYTTLGTNMSNATFNRPFDNKVSPVEYIKYILLVSAIFTHTVAAYLLIKKKSKKVMHLLLINLVLTELLFVIQELAMLSLFHPMVYTKIRMTIKHVLIFSMHSGIVLITLDRVTAVSPMHIM